MRLKHFDYIKLVTEAYNKKKTDNQLSLLLSQPTPGNIRRECANVYQERFENRDEQMLRAFFGPAEHGRKFLALIQEFDVDRFRPLDKYLKEEGKKTITDRNLELLAWLIDFKYRPYSSDKDVILSDEESALLKNDVEKRPVPASSVKKEEEDNQERVYKESPALINDVPNNSDNGRSKRMLMIFLMLIICTAGVYTVWQQKEDRRLLMQSASNGCMYWAENHYERVSCKEKGKGFLVPLDEERIKNFRKITREDTITEKLIGIIYYLKTDNKMEYFTAGGNHPVYINRRLKALSRYMFNIYLDTKKTADKDSLGLQNVKLITNR